MFRVAFDIRNRIDIMLGTGIKRPLGVKAAGDGLAEIERAAQSVERAVNG